MGIKYFYRILLTTKKNLYNRRKKRKFEYICMYKFGEKYKKFSMKIN